MPQYGYMYNLMEPLMPQIGKAKRFGCDFIEIYIEPPNMPALIIKNSGAIRRELKKHGIFCTVHMAYWAELGSEIEIVRLAWMREALTALAAAASIGAKKFVVHARAAGMSLLIPKNKKTVMDNFIKSFGELAGLASKYGMKVAIENESLGERLTIGDFVHIARSVKSACITMDTGHIFMSRGRNSDIRAFIRKLGKRIEHCHFSDNRGSEDEHLPIGKGGIDYAMVVRELRRMGYDKTITFEIFQGGDAGFRSSLKAIRELWKGR